MTKLGSLELPRLGAQTETSEVLEVYAVLRSRSPGLGLEGLRRFGTSISLDISINTYINTCIHPYIHPCMHAYMHIMCINTYMYVCIYTYIHIIAVPDASNQPPIVGPFLFEGLWGLLQRPKTRFLVIKKVCLHKGPKGAFLLSITPVCH